MDDTKFLNGKSSCGMAVMAKASLPGRAKTRMVPPLTPDEAAAVNTAFVQDIADNVIAAGRHASIAGYAAYAPQGAEAFFRGILPPAFGLIEACLPNLGECLVHTIGEIFARGHGSAIVLNSDSPTLPTALLIEAAEALARPGDRAVFGPASDGGYYLLGLKTVHRRLFEDIAWSTERVADQTLERAREIKLDIHTLSVWYDVDDIEGLYRLHREMRHPGSAARPLEERAPNYPAATAFLLERLFGGRELLRLESGTVGTADT